jgi:hypothetical protein
MRASGGRREILGIFPRPALPVKTRPLHENSVERRLIRDEVRGVTAVGLIPAVKFSVSTERRECEGWEFPIRPILGFTQSGGSIRQCYSQVPN